jgi:probable rRNA maturation factor
MQHQIDIQDTVAENTPSQTQLTHWASVCLHDRLETTNLCIRIVDRAEMTTLNHKFRQQNKPTNVLAFPLEPQATTTTTQLLGDVVICADIVHDEAQQQGKSSIAHWAHLTIHGILHLLGYDHQNTHAATIMESLEIKLLANLGFPNPYERQ